MSLAEPVKVFRSILSRDRRRAERREERREKGGGPTWGDWCDAMMDLWVDEPALKEKQTSIEATMEALDVAGRAVDDLEAALQADDIEEAILAAHRLGYAKGCLQLHRDLFEAARATVKRQDGRIFDAHRAKQAIERQQKVRLARELWAEYDPADVKGKDKRNAAYKEIAEIMQLRLKLTEPIKPGTVRDYLHRKKTVEG